MILSCQNISKSFGTDEILKNVSFHIEANEKAAIVGINGAGKSTLLKIIMQKETPDTGEVILAKTPPSAIWRSIRMCPAPDHLRGGS